MDLVGLGILQEVKSQEPAAHYDVLEMKTIMDGEQMETFMLKHLKIIIIITENTVIKFQIMESVKVMHNRV